MPSILIGQYDDFEAADAAIADTPVPPEAQTDSVAAPTEPQTVMIQAHRDIARGLEDTDCYTRLGKLIPRPRKK